MMIKNQSKARERTSTDELMDEASALALSRDQLARLRYCASIHRGTKGERRRAGEIVAEIRRELMAGVSETIALETARGGEVRDFNNAGAKRLAARDGLLSLYRSGHLTSDQAGAGLAYRRAMEARGAMVCASLLHTAGSTDIEHRLGSWWTRARLGVHAANVDRAVALELKHRPDALDTLRRVAGYGQSVRSLAPGGKQFNQRVEALAMALEIAARYRVEDPT